MPTKDEVVALGNAVNSALTTNYQGSGISGLVLTDKTDSSKVLFLPVAGDCGNGTLYHVGYYGSYWTSSLTDEYEYRAHYVSFDFNRDIVNWSNYDDRCLGSSVRLVKDI
jgi:hypothetical protein